MNSKLRSATIFVLISTIVVFLSASNIALSQTYSTANSAGAAQLQKQIAETKAQIERIKIEMAIEKIIKEIAQLQLILERVKMYGLTLHQTIPDIILKGLYPINVSQESATTTTVVTATTTANSTSTTTETAANASTTISTESYAPIYEPLPELPPPSAQAPQPVVCAPTASGARTYSVSTKENPRIIQVVIDPLDVQESASQVVSVSIQETNGKPITGVSGSAVTDNASLPFYLSLVSGTETNGIWQGSWTNQDTYCQRYMITITASSESGQSRVELSFK